LVNRQDAHGVPEGHPQHDPCSLLVPETALRQMTRFNRQVRVIGLMLCSGVAPGIWIAVMPLSRWKK